MPVEETGVHIFVEKLRTFLKEEGGRADATISEHARWCRRFMIYLVRNNGSDATYPLKILKFELKLPGANSFDGEIPTFHGTCQFYAAYLKVCYIVK